MVMSYVASTRPVANAAGDNTAMLWQWWLPTSNSSKLADNRRGVSEQARNKKRENYVHCSVLLSSPPPQWTFDHRDTQNEPTLPIDIDTGNEHSHTNQLLATPITHDNASK